MKSTLTNENIVSACRFASAYMKERKVSSGDSIRYSMQIEEALLKFRKKFGEQAVFSIDTSSGIGGAKLRITVQGAYYNPFAPDAEDDETDEFMHIALSRMGEFPAWRYSRGNNVLIFVLERRRIPEWVKLIGSIGGAFLVGFLLRMAPAEVRDIVRGEVVEPVLGAFMGLLNAVAGPMIFLSVVWGIYSIGDASTFSVLGKRLALKYASSLLLLTSGAAAASLPFIRIAYGSGQGLSGVSELFAMILDIIPSNLFTPFTSGNMLQILFIAIVMGITMIHIAGKTGNVAILAEELGYIVDTVMGFVAKMVPFFIFGSILKIIVSDQIGAVRAAGKLFFGVVIACAVLLIVETAVTVIRTGLSPQVIWQRSFPTFLIGLTTASSSAAFSENLRTITEKYGVEKKLANFAVPFGQILYKPAVAIMFWIAAITTAESSGMTVSVPWLITALMMSIVLSAATPPIPGGAIASFTALFAQLGLPNDKLALVMTINVLVDFFRTGTNLFCGQCALLDCARSFKAPEEQ